jgi:hypothetical protein
VVSGFYFILTIQSGKSKRDVLEHPLIETAKDEKIV